MVNFYDRKILPYLVEKVCSGRHFKRLREEKISFIKGIGLELGGGIGLNLPYYSDETEKLFVIEPCSVSQKKANSSARNCHFEVEHIDYLQNGKIPLDDHSLDFVCSTWTLCTIKNIEETLLEIKRILKPGGEFHFLEHGLAPERFIALTQHTLNPVQKFFGGGCNLNRQIDKYILDAGFVMKSFDNFYMPGFKIGGYLYSGIATASEKQPK